MQPRKGALDDPTGFAKSAAMRRVALGKRRGDAARFERASQRLGIVPPVGQNQLRFALRGTAFAANRRDRFQQRQQCVTSFRFACVRITERGRPWASVRRWRFEPALRRSVGFGPLFFPRAKARTKELSATARERSIRSAAELCQQPLVQSIPHTRLLPTFEATPATHAAATAHFFGQHFPGNPRPQHKEHAGQRLAIGQGFASGALAPTLLGRR